MEPSDLSRRDKRTKSGVLTPGINATHESALKGRQIVVFKRWSIFGNAKSRSTAPSGRAIFYRNPGLKPRAESFYPFGISPERSEQTGFRNLSFCHLLFVMPNEPQAGSAFDCTGSQSRDQTPLNDGEKYDGRYDGDDRAGCDQSPFDLQALQEAL